MAALVVALGVLLFAMLRWSRGRRGREGFAAAPYDARYDDAYDDAGNVVVVEDADTSALDAIAGDPEGDPVTRQQRDVVQPTWKTDPGGFLRPVPGTHELTGGGVMYADPLRCTHLTSGYSFTADALVAHPRSTPEAPKCIFLRAGMGLLSTEDPLACLPVPDVPSLHWANPLNQAGNGGAIQAVYPDHESGVDRCTISFDPSASEVDLRRVDRAMKVAGAEARTGFPGVLRKLELTSDALVKTTASLAKASARLDVDVPQMDADAVAIDDCKRVLKLGEEKLEKLATDTETAMDTAIADFEGKYRALKDNAISQLRDRISKDQTQLDGALVTQKANDEAACKLVLQPLQDAADAAKAAADAAALATTSASLDSAAPVSKSIPEAPAPAQWPEIVKPVTGFFKPFRAMYLGGVGNADFLDMYGDGLRDGAFSHTVNGNMNPDKYPNKSLDGKWNSYSDKPSDGYWFHYISPTAIDVLGYFNDGKLTFPGHDTLGPWTQQ